jgi:hypothetical protein
LEQQKKIIRTYVREAQETLDWERCNFVSDNNTTRTSQRGDEGKEKAGGRDEEEDGGRG